MAEEEKNQQSDNQNASADTQVTSSDSNTTPPVSQEEPQTSIAKDSSPEESVDGPPSKERRNFLKVIATAGGI